MQTTATAAKSLLFEPIESLLYGVNRPDGRRMRSRSDKATTAPVFLIGRMSVAVEGEGPRKSTY
jgi:hypothetical protein